MKNLVNWLHLQHFTLACWLHRHTAEHPRLNKLADRFLSWSGSKQDWG